MSQELKTNLDDQSARKTEDPGAHCTQPKLPRSKNQRQHGHNNNLPSQGSFRNEPQEKASKRDSSPPSPALVLPTLVIQTNSSVPKVLRSQASRPSSETISTPFAASCSDMRPARNGATAPVKGTITVEG